jgi:hypothetical protein
MPGAISPHFFIARSLVKYKDNFTFNYLVLFIYIQLVYDVKKRGMMVPFKGEKDICQELAKASRDPTVAANLKKYNIGPTCPVKEVSEHMSNITLCLLLKICGNK